MTDTPKPAYHSSLSAFTDVVKEAVAEMSKAVEGPEDDPLPLFHVLTHSGQEHVIAVPFGNDAEKREMAKQVPSFIAALNPKFIAFFASAWVLQMPKGSSMPEVRAMKVSEHPEKQECGMLVVSKGDGECLMSYAPLLRNEGRITYGEWKDGGDKGEGLFADVIHRSFALARKDA